MLKYKTNSTQMDVNAIYYAVIINSPNRGYIAALLHVFSCHFIAELNLSVSLNSDDKNTPNAHIYALTY